LLIVVSLLTQEKDKPKPLVDIDGNPVPIKNWMGLGFRSK